MYKFGFDLTTFSECKDFTAVLEKLGATTNARLDSENEYFVWEGVHGTLITANNPLSGTYAQAGKRKNEKGYASYMRLETFDRATGDNIADFINSKADVKDFTRGTARFI